MFGIGGGEMIFIIFIALMLFGTDKIPEFARTFGKGMAQLRNATNEIKSEIHKSGVVDGLDPNSLTGGFTTEIENVKNKFRTYADSTGITGELNAVTKDIGSLAESTVADPLNLNEINVDINSEINKAKEDIEQIASGPIKRQR